MKGILPLTIAFTILVSHIFTIFKISSIHIRSYIDNFIVDIFELQLYAYTCIFIFLGFRRKFFTTTH